MQMETSVEEFCKYQQVVQTRGYVEKENKEAKNAKSSKRGLTDNC